MAAVTLTIGGRPHQVACRDGGEARVRMLGAMIEEHWAAADRASAGNVERAFLLIALMLADALDDSRNRPPAGAAVSEPALLRIADRLESLADALEQAAPTS